ncbi:ABC transporter C family protein, putative [Medicago truncatula]|uniref:ABC transporter C family protein, putative n=1 Tax=Medicago truncatula TaxID=3880 RepID=A0A072TWS2_MEDTR|nr:ABC transporter C family protein, putative [Medicago truncatula]
MATISLTCLLEHVTLPLEFGFLVILLVQLLRNCMNNITKQNKVSEVHPNCIKFGFPYKISLACTTLLLAIHALMLILMLNHEPQCTSKLQTYTSEIIQVLSSATILIAICKMSKTNANFHWIVRLWWFFSFLLSIISTALHVYFSIKNKGVIGIKEYADFLGLVVSTCLLVVSTRGKTGIVIIATNGSISEPLLEEKNEKHSSECLKESPYGKATIFQLINFSWLNPLFAVGYKKPLQLDDIPNLDIKDSAEYLNCAFDESLR